jgi:hypothetical protein
MMTVTLRLRHLVVFAVGAILALGLPASGGTPAVPPPPTERVVRILFSTEVAGHEAVFSMSPDGSDTRAVVVTPTASVGSPDVSPDGTMLIYTIRCSRR